MPPKSKRLQAKDFVSNQKSTTYKRLYFDVKVLFNNKGKFACVIKKNISGNAVIRNKIRRRVYSIMSSVFKNNTQSIIIFPRKEALLQTYQTLLDETVKISKEIKI